MGQSELNQRQLVACRKLLVNLGTRAPRGQEFNRLVVALAAKQQLRIVRSTPPVWAVRYVPTGGADVISCMCFSSAEVVAAVTDHFDQLYRDAEDDSP